MLLQRLADVHAIHYGYEKTITNNQFNDFVQEVVNRLGANVLLTPGEIIRDFISVLNILQQNPEISFEQLIHSSSLPLSAADKNFDMDENSEVAEFTL